MLPRGGTLIIRAQDSVDAVQIELSDTGCGIEPANLEEVFDPFFSTKRSENSSPEQSGFGLGLAFCKKVMDLHRGSISVESELGRGTTFRIILPQPHRGIG